MSLSFISFLLFLSSFITVSKYELSSFNKLNIIFFDLKNILIEFLVSSFDIRLKILRNKDILSIVFIDEIIPSTTFINKICFIFSLFLSLLIIEIIPSMHLFITFFFNSLSICNSFILSFSVK